MTSRRGNSVPAAPQRFSVEAPQSKPPRLMLGDIDDFMEQRVATEVNRVSQSGGSQVARETAPVGSVHAKFLAWQQGVKGSASSRSFSQRRRSETSDQEVKQVTFSSKLGSAMRTLTRSLTRSGTTLRPGNSEEEKRAYLKGSRSTTFSVNRAREPNRMIPMPEVPSGFRTLGEFVDHCRFEQEQELRVRQGLEPLARDRDEEVIDIGDHVSSFPAIADLSELKKPDEDDIWAGREAATELRIAARDNDAARIRILLDPPTEKKKPVPVDLPDACGETAAVVAARAGCAASCSALLDGGADPLCRDLHPNCFSDAVWPDERRPDTHGLHPDKCSQDMEPGRTVVYHLRLRGILEQVLRSVFPMTRIKLVCSIADGIQRFHLKCPMMVAAKQGYADLMGLLVAHIAAVPHAPPPMWSGESEAEEAEDTTTIDPGQPWRPTRDACGQALMEAMLASKWRCAEILVASRIPRLILNQEREKKAGKTVLHISAAAGKTEIVKQLLLSGASTAPFSKTGMQPLHYACSAGHCGVVQALLEGGADPKVASWDLPHSRVLRSKDSGKTPLTIALSRGHKDIADVLKQFQVAEDQANAMALSGTGRAGFPRRPPAGEPMRAWSSQPPRGAQARPATR